MANPDMTCINCGKGKSSNGSCPHKKTITDNLCCFCCKDQDKDICNTKH